MKPFLGIDITNDKHNEQENGKEFLVAEPSSALAQSLETSLEDGLGGVLEKAKIPLALRIIQVVCGFVGGVSLVGLLKAIGGEDGVSLAQGYQNAPWLYWGTGACLLVFAALTWVGKKKEKAVLESDESEMVFNNLNAVSDAIYRELQVPESRKSVDILSFRYKIKNDEMKVCESLTDLAPYENSEYDMYVENDALCMVDLRGKYALPLSSLRRIQMVKKRIAVSDWNKEEEPNKGVYKPFKLSADDNGCVHMKSYGILEFEHNNELWGIYFPCYELPVFEELTGLCAE